MLYFFLNIIRVFPKIWGSVKNYPCHPVLLWIFGFCYIILPVILFTVAVLRVDPSVGTKIVWSCPTKELAIFNAELRSFEEVTIHLETMKAKAQSRQFWFKVMGGVLGVVGIVLILKGLKPEFWFGSGRSSEQGSTATQPNESILGPLSTADSQSLINTTGIGVDSATLLETGVLHNVIHDMVCIDICLAAMAGRLIHGLPWNERSGLYSSDPHATIQYCELAPSLMTPEQLGGWLTVWSDEVTAFLMGGATQDVAWNKAVLEACLRLQSLAKRSKEDPLSLKDWLYTPELDRLQDASWSLHQAMGDLISQGLQAGNSGGVVDIVDLVLQLDEVLKPLY